MAFTLYKHAWVWIGPEYEEPQLSSTECKALLKKGGWLVRNTYDFDCGEETGFWYVVKDSFGGTEQQDAQPAAAQHGQLYVSAYDGRRAADHGL